MLQHSEPDDFVLATGEMHSGREFCEIAFSHIGMTLRWEGPGVDEIGYDGDNDRVLIEIDPIYFRPTEVEQLLGDASKARDQLGWTATIRFDELVKEMVTEDVSLLKLERLARRTYGVVE